MIALPPALRVLVVDNTRHVANTLTATLKARGYRTLRAYTSNDAVSLAAAFRPDVLIAEALLPGLNGFEIAGKIRAELPDCRVLLLTADPNEAARARDALPRPVPARLLAKPISSSEVLAFLANCAFALCHERPHLTVRRPQ